MELLLFEEGKRELYRSDSVPGFLQMNPQTSTLPLPATVCWIRGSRFSGCLCELEFEYRLIWLQRPCSFSLPQPELLCLLLMPLELLQFWSHLLLSLVAGCGGFTSAERKGAGYSEEVNGEHTVKPLLPRNSPSPLFSDLKWPQFKTLILENKSAIVFRNHLLQYTHTTWG